MTCVLVDVVEALVAVALGVHGGRSIAPQAAAPPPFGLFSDIRWLLVYASSWPTFAAGALAVLSLRSLLTGWQAYLAWPEPKPSFGRLLARSTVANVGLGLLLAPFAVVLFGFAAFSLSWLYIAAVPSVIVLGVLLHETSLSRRWWRHAPGATSLGWMLFTVVVLTGAAGLVSTDPAVLALPVSATVGVFESIAWARVTGDVAGRGDGHFLPVVPVTVVLFVSGAVLGAATGFSAARHSPAAPAAGPSPTSLPGRRAVLLVAGFASHWDGKAVELPGAPPGSVVSEFSYRGLDASGHPMPYSADATHASLDHLAGLMRRQVAQLVHSTGELVDIVAVSEGSAVAETYLESITSPPVDTVVFVSPLLDPGAASFPESGEEGRGMVAGQALALLGSWLAPISSVDLSPNQPFLRSLVNQRPSTASPSSCAAGCHEPREVEIVPIADAVASAPSPRSGLTTVVVPEFHGANFSDPAVRYAMAAALAGRPLSSDRTERFFSHVIAGLASAWRLPT